MDKNLLGHDLIKRLTDEVLESAAVNHPYLNSFSNGELPDMDFAIKDFAFQYGLYNVRFVRYLSAVINNLSSDNHKCVLQSNLDEETGSAHDVELPADVLASIDKLSHTQLYRRFQHAVGVDLDRITSDCSNEIGSQWSREFIGLCESNECVGVGAIGFGTELIVSHIYNQILQGIKSYTDLTMSQRIFFELHRECDDQHAAQLIKVAEELATNEKACQQIEYGVNMAVKLRVEFWNNMLNRALNYSNYKNLETREAI